MLEKVRAVVRSDTLDYDAMYGAAQTFFPGGSGVDDERFRLYSRSFYRHLDLAGSAAGWTPLDLDLLDAAFPVAVQVADLGAYVRARARMLIVGCGPGRLARNYLDFARQHGIRYVTFNDLSESHLRATCRTVFNHLGPVNVSLHAGDAATIPGEGVYDIIIALFFVTAEICTVSSERALRERRAAFFRAMARLLCPGGVLIDDTPERDLPGYYKECGDMTAEFDGPRTVMPAEARNLSFAYIPAKTMSGHAYFCRYVPSGAARLQELTDAGFRHLYGWTGENHADRRKPSVARRLKRLDLWVRT